jgi:hypothetical protein
MKEIGGEGHLDFGLWRAHCGLCRGGYNGQDIGW